MSKPSEQTTVSDGQWSQVERLITLNEQANERSQYLEMMVRRLELMLVPPPQNSPNRGFHKTSPQTHERSLRGDIKKSFDLKAKRLDSLNRSSTTSSCT